MKLLVGVPTYAGHSFCRLEFIEKLKTIKARHDADIYIVWNGDRNEKTSAFQEYKDIGCEVRRILNSGEEGIAMLAKKQNMIRDEFLSGDYTHLLMLESDNIPPDDVVDKLSSHKVHVVSGLYFINSTHGIVKPAPKDLIKDGVKKGIEDFQAVMIIKQVPIPSVWSVLGCQIFEDTNNQSTEAVRLWTIDDYVQLKMDNKRLIPIYASGVGCILFDRYSMEKIPFNAKMAIKGQEKQLTDFIWFFNAYKNGIESYVDLDCIVSHKHFGGLNALSEINKWFDPKELERDEYGSE